MPLNRKYEIIEMPAENERPTVAGAGIVKVMIMTLVLLLIGRKFGIPVSFANLIYAAVLAALLYFLWRKMTEHFSGGSR